LRGTKGLVRTYCKRRWIPIYEILPEPEQIVLLWYAEEMMFTPGYLAWHGSSWILRDQAIEIDINNPESAHLITHWMEIDEPEIAAIPRFSLLKLNNNEIEILEEMLENILKSGDRPGLTSVWEKLEALIYGKDVVDMVFKKEQHHSQKGGSVAEGSRRARKRASDEDGHAVESGGSSHEDE